MNVILEGVVGSTAYGLAREGSDEDKLGVFVAPTREVAGLHWNPKRESKVSTSPDVTHHEIGKFLRLALKCNPTVTELLWLEKYETSDGAGQSLLGIRRSLLSRKFVQDAYQGYAFAQIKRLQERTDGTFSSDTRKRTVKHARHMLRLLRQGRQLLEDGELAVRVSNPEEYFAFDDYTIEQMVDVYDREQMLTNTAAEKSKLPEQPNAELAQLVLETVRRGNF